MAKLQGSSRSYDAIVIGSGQGGKPLARALAGAGRKTALIEKSHVGGTCVNVGCTPTKTMVSSARVAYLARRAAEYGVTVGPVRVDLKSVRKRTQSVVTSFREGSQKGIEKTKNLDLIFGEASFEDARSLEVLQKDGDLLQVSAQEIFINTGVEPARPAIDGIETVPNLDSTSILNLEDIPKHLIVLGGGYVGLEFGQMFRRFGSQVTLVQRPGQLLPREDPDVAEAVAEIFREDGIEVLLEATAVKTSKGEAGEIHLEIETSEGERTLVGSHLLCATGRKPNTDRLCLKAAGVEKNEREFIQVNEKLETSAAGIYALGDVTGGPAFTHISYDDFRVLKANLIDGEKATTLDRTIPYTVFIDPQLGRVGLTEKEAREKEIDFKVAKLSMTHVARAIEGGETRGFMKALVDAETDLILGCAILGIEGGEVMSVLQMAMMGKVPYPAIRDGIFAHPTLSESLNNLFMTLKGVKKK